MTTDSRGLVLVAGACATLARATGPGGDRARVCGSIGLHPKGPFPQGECESAEFSPRAVKRAMPDGKRQSCKLPGPLRAKTPKSECADCGDQDNDSAMR